MGPKRGLGGAQAYRENPPNTIFQNPIQKNSFPENFTWVEAVRKNPFLFLGRNIPMQTVRARPVDENCAFFYISACTCIITACSALAQQRPY
jgi:hypothetical protein